MTDLTNPTPLPSGYKNGQQAPLDGKTYFENNADLIDVANERPLEWYKEMESTNRDTGEKYVWRESETGLISGGYTYPANIISFGFDYSGKKFNWVEVFVNTSSDESNHPGIENIGDAGVEIYDSLSLMTNNHQLRKIKSETLGLSIENDAIKAETKPYRLQLDEHDIQLTLDGNVVDSIPLCDVIEACLLANPQIICNIVAYDCPTNLNLPPDALGDNSINTGNRSTYAFTVANFTTGTTPAYNDPETDAMESIRINTLPDSATGTLIYNASVVYAGQIISSSDIALGLLTLVSPDLDSETTSVFNFSARDTGSMLFPNNTITGNISVISAESGTITNPIEVGLGSCSIIPTVWDPVYTDNPGGFWGNGKVLYTDVGQTTPYNGGGDTYRKRTNGAGTMTIDVFTISNLGVVGNIAICQSGPGGGSGGSMFMTSSIPQSNGGGYSGTLDVFNGEPNEVLTCSFQLTYDNGATAEGISFQNPPVNVSTLEPLHTSRTGTITLDANGDASSSYQVYSGGSSGMSCVVTIVSRTSAEPVPSGNDAKTTISV